MKKLFSILLILLISFGLIGCNKTPEPTNLEQLSEALDSLILESDTDSNYIFPSTGLNNVTITWESSNEAVIADDGTVTIPLFTEGDSLVTITASLSLGDDTLLKTFDVNVIAASTLSNTEKLI